MQGRSRFVLDVVTTVALVLASAVVVWAVVNARSGSAPPPEKRERPAPTLPAVPLALEGALIGQQTAAAGIVMFSDFECPFCGTFATSILPGLLERYVKSGQLVISFRHLPLKRIHKNATYAAELAVCSTEAGLFWPVHDQFFQKPAPESPEEFKKRATAAGMKPKVLDACLASGRAGSQVNTDLKLAADLKVESTPWFYVGKVVDGKLTAQSVIRGARPLAEFEEAIRKVK